LQQIFAWQLSIQGRKKQKKTCREMVEGMTSQSADCQLKFIELLQVKTLGWGNQQQQVTFEGCTLLVKYIDRIRPDAGDQMPQITGSHHPAALRFLRQVYCSRRY
jgi:hypothetical protein